MKMTLPARLRPLELHPGDLDHDFTEAANLRRRLADLRDAFLLLRWAFVFVAVLSCLATLAMVYLAR